MSGGAKGIDQAAMRGSLEAGGQVCGILADGLEKTTMNRDHRNLLLDGQLMLISPYDPSAGFNVGNAMQRNKLIYALADISLVVSSDLNKGGTWAGAVEQLDKLKFVPVFVRSTGESSAGLDALRRKGALPWPNPQDVASLAEVFKVQTPAAAGSPQVGLSLFSNDEPPAADATPKAPILLDAAPAPQAESGPSAPVGVVSDAQPAAAVPKEPPPATSELVAPAAEARVFTQPESTPAELLFSAVRAAIRQLLTVPMRDAEVAAALDVSNAQAKAWLQRMVDKAELDKLGRPVRYVVSPQGSLLDNNQPPEANNSNRAAVGPRR